MADSKSKSNILAALRRSNVPDTERPSLDQAWTTYADPQRQFVETLEAVGGRCITVPDPAAIGLELEGIAPYADAQRVYSAVAEVAGRNVNPETIDDAHALEDVDFAVLPGEFAVAENAAVWATDAGLPQRVIFFIAQHLALVVPADQIVHNMHQAYQRLSFENPEFGVFISGPSKTADIEQSLVIGAHGARSLTVFLVG